MRPLLCALFMLLSATQARAQAPLSTLRMIYVQQQQVDGLQARLDGPGTHYAVATVDTALFNAGGALEVRGWAFRCGQDDGGSLTIVIDGVQSVQSGPFYFTRYPRADVANAPNTALCAQAGSYVPTLKAGFMTLVDMAPYLSGWNGDGWHTVGVRIYDAAGKMTSSASIPVFR